MRVSSGAGQTRRGDDDVQMQGADDDDPGPSSAGSIECGGDDPLADRRVLPGDGLRQVFVFRQRRGNPSKPLDRLDVGPALRHRVEPARIGEGIEIDRPGVAAATQRHQQLDGLDGMHRPRHQAVVAFAVPVVE